MATLVQDVEALRKHLGVQQLSSMGQSFGGTIALEYAASYPENVPVFGALLGLYVAQQAFEERTQPPSRCLMVL